MKVAGFYPLASGYRFRQDPRAAAIDEEGRDLRAAHDALLALAGQR